MKHIFSYIEYLTESKNERPRTFYRGVNLNGGKRTKTGYEYWDSMLFCSDDIQNAKLYGNDIITIKAKPSTNIVYEGTKEWRELKKGITGITTNDWHNIKGLNSLVKKAREQGNIDAIWFKRQSDYGTGILNKKSFIFDIDEKYD